MYDYIIHKFQYMHIYTYSPKLLVCICLFFLTYKNDSLIFIRQENSVSLKQLKVIIPKLASILLKSSFRYISKMPLKIRQCLTFTLFRH